MPPPPQYFFLSKNRFFATELKRGKEKYFLNDCLGGAMTREKK